VTVETITEPEVKPSMGDVPTDWPPLQHIRDKRKGPLKEGALALCGAKLMGIDLGRLQEARGKVCDKCVEIAKKELGL